MKHRVNYLSLKNKRPSFTRARTTALAILVLIASGCAHGCVESNFTLAPESRLPHGIQLPSGYSRADVILESYYYTGGDTEFVLSSRYHKTLSKTLAKHWWHPRTEKALAVYYATEPRPEFPDPSYIVVAVNGEVDVIEHRHKEQNTRDPKVALFWMAEDAEIIREAVDSSTRKAAKVP
jgi:hypothetical protein